MTTNTTSHGKPSRPDGCGMEGEDLAANLGCGPCASGWMATSPALQRSLQGLICTCAPVALSAGG